MVDRNAIHELTEERSKMSKIGERTFRVTLDSFAQHREGVSHDGVSLKRTPTKKMHPAASPVIAMMSS